MSKLGIVFPGQGSQYVGMGKDLHDLFAQARQVFEEAGDVLHIDMKDLCFSGPQAALDQTVNTQISILTVNVAAYRVCESELGVRPFVMAGHSLGEYSALHAARAITFHDALKLVHTRGRHQQEAVPAGAGSMAAIMGGISRDAIEAICREVTAATAGVVEPATYNAPSQFVISGATDAVEEAIRRAKSRGAKRAVKLPISVPCHSSLLDGAARRFGQDLRTVTMNDCAVQVISNYDPSLFFSRENAGSLLAKLVSSPVRWQETAERMFALGIDTVIETGPKRVLSGLMKRINASIRTANIEDGQSLNKTREILNGYKADHAQ
jgi:[acyl-carrier-protein] S-malonyltransferase